MTEKRHFSAEQGPLRQTPEQELRKRLIRLVKNTPDHRFSSTVGLYNQFDLFPTEKQFKATLITGLETARKSTVWQGSADDTIHLGYYSDDASFYSMFLHEFNHYALTKFGKDRTSYLAEAENEEEFCWDSAKTLTDSLSLPFNQELHEISMQGFRIYRQLQLANGEDKKLQKQLEALDKEERRLGLPMLSNATVTWTKQGRPQLTYMYK